MNNTDFMFTRNGTTWNYGNINGISISTRITSYMIIISTILTGILGNVSLIMCIYGSKALRTYMNAFLVSLASADLLTCVATLPLRLTLYLVTFTRYVSRRYVCYSAIFFDTWGSTVQMLTLCAVSYERYQAIAHPFEKEFQKRRTIGSIVGTWCIGLALAVISVNIDTPLYYRCVNHDMETIRSWNKHGFLIVVPIGCLSLILIFIFYGRIIRVLINHGLVMAQTLNVKKSRIAPELGQKGAQSSNVDSRSITNVIEFKPTRLRKETVIGNAESVPLRSQRNTTVNNVSKMPDVDTTCTDGQNETVNQASKSNSADAEIQNATISINTVKLKPNSATGISSSPSVVEVVDMNGKVKLARVKQESQSQIQGSVCVMNSKNKEQGRRRVELRSTKKMAVVIAIFVSCWIALPITLIASLALPLSDVHTAIINEMAIVAGSLASLSSGVNPLMYGLSNKLIRTQLKRYKNKLYKFVKKN